MGKRYSLLLTPASFHSLICNRSNHYWCDGFAKIYPSCSKALLEFGRKILSRVTHAPLDQAP